MRGSQHLTPYELADLGYRDLSHISETDEFRDSRAHMRDGRNILINSSVGNEPLPLCERLSGSPSGPISLALSAWVTESNHMRGWWGLVVPILAAIIFCFQSTVWAEERYLIAIIPKIVGIDYYDAAKRGIDEADRELHDVDIIWAGPTQDQVEKQVEIIENMIPSKPDLIAVAANDPVRIVPVLKQAKAAGIRIMSWDGDTDFREFFVNLVDYDEFGRKIVEAMVEQVGSEADIAIVTTTFTAPNQVHWIKAIKKVIYDNYPDLRILDIRPATESTERSYRIGQAYLQEFPTLKGIIALGVPNVPGVVRAVEDAGLAGRIAVVGNATPNLTRDFLKNGLMQKVFLWNAPDHGYLTVYSAYRLLTEGLQPGMAFNAGRLGRMTPKRDETSMQVALPVMTFTKDNVDQHEF